MLDPDVLLDEAQKAAPRRTKLAPYLESIRTLRDKQWSWREIAEFLRERGVVTDHTRLLRFAQRHGQPWRVPSADKYYEALKQALLARKVAAAKWAMLMHLYRAHNRCATYTSLANAAAQAGAKVPAHRPNVYADLEFGKLGKLLGQAVGIEFLPSGNRDQPFFSSAIGIASSATPDGGEFELVMHHELAKALDRLLSEYKDVESTMALR